jgi:hypothetical protein
VSEQQRAAALLAPRLSRIEHFAEIGDAGMDRRELLEMEVGHLSKKARDGGLPCSRRAPEDH